MKMRTDFRNIVGYLLVGAFLAGCFVPVAYGVYKVYEDAHYVKVTLNVKEKPDVVYSKVAAAIEEKGVWKIAKREDEKMVLDLKKGEEEGYVKVSALAGKEASVVTIAVEKGKDPEKQRKELVQTALAGCSKLGLECTEEKKD